MSDRTVTLIGSDGQRWTLACDPASPYQLGVDPGIHGLPRIALQSARRSPLMAGEVLDQVKIGTRILKVPVYIDGATEDARDLALRSLAQSLDPQRGPCRLIWRRPGTPAGTGREITAYLAGPENWTLREPASSVPVVLIFEAFDPYWRIAGIESWGAYGGSLPDGLGSAMDAPLLNNQGSVETWPEWIITGPCENVQALSVATGQMWRITEVLTAGQVVRIQTDPRTRGVWLGDDLRGDIMDGEADELWGLRPGLNWVWIRAVNPTDLGTFDIRWPHRYASA
ncbi:MAG: hypothetical protein ACRCW4_13385 [Candidatus Neomicrothrix subdominans]